MSILRDFTGQRFGKILIIERDFTKTRVSWKYICDCGNYGTIRTDSLRFQNKCRKCHMKNIKVIMGKKYDEILKSYIGYITKEGCIVLDAWRKLNIKNIKITFVKVRCFCVEQTEFITTWGNISGKNPNTKSCGHYKKEMTIKFNKESKTLSSGIANFNKVLYSYIRNAKNRGYQWNLTKEFCYDLMQCNCHYCDSEPIEFHAQTGLNGIFFGNSLDRINNLLGYNICNVNSCCQTCNGLKLDSSLEEWQEKIERILKINYDNLFFNYNFQEVSEEILKLQRGNYGEKRRSLKKKKIKFNLSLQEFCHLATSNCFYCNIIPENFTKGVSKDFYQGIDRKNNNIGYIFENCLPCCKSCNTAKSNMPYDDFIEYLKKFQNYQKILLVA